MNELKRIADELRRAYSGDAWHGPSLMAVLKEVAADQASARPIARAHSIWEIVLHLTTWNQVVERRLSGETAQITEEQDWPRAVETSAESWSKCLLQLDASHGSLASAIEAKSKRPNSDNILSRIVPGKDHSYYVMLQGAVQHLLYHAGQMAILKKALR